MKPLIYIAFVSLLFAGCSTEPTSQDQGGPSYTLIDSRCTYRAGDRIQLQFEGERAGRPLLWIHTAFGSSLVRPDSDEDLTTFTLPKALAEKSGVATWELIMGERVLAKGTIHIQAHSSLTSPIASYLGPRSIAAGGDDFTMLVTIPTDRYDNPLADSTQLTFKQQYGNHIEETPVAFSNGVGWKNFYSPERSGRLLMTASLEAGSGKELTATVHSAQATEFSIDYRRNHTYADGHQVITFFTDEIKDAFGNTVSDGTLVNFLVTNAQGWQLRTMGTTLNGKAHGELLHPDRPAKWTVTAYVTGAAKSNTLSLDFQPALSDFKLSTSPDGRVVQLSELRSFMGQLIPDGIPVSLKISTPDGVSLETMRTTSLLGAARFELPSDFYANGTYVLKAQAAGVQKTKTIRLQ